MPPGMAVESLRINAWIGGCFLHCWTAQQAGAGVWYTDAGVGGCEGEHGRLGWERCVIVGETGTLPHRA
eukprot:365454-Chlamydomonas_euryale.AAC.4